MSRSSQILVIASDFPPRQAAGVYRTLRFARYLPELGWDVHVLTVASASYEEGAKTDEALMDKLPDRVTIHDTRAVYPMQWLKRVKRWSPSGRNRSSQSGSTMGTENAGQAAPQNGTARSNGASSAAAPRKPSFWQGVKDSITLPLMTPDKTVGWVPFAVHRGKRIVQRHDIDILYSSGPPWSNHLVGLKLKQASNRPWIADFRDPWVGSDYRPQRRGETWVGRKHQHWERAVVEAADYVILNTPRACEDMRSRHADKASEKFVVIPNGYDPADYLDCENGQATQNEKLTIAHAGSFYGRRSVGTFIEALGRVCREGAIPRDRISVQLIGALRKGRSVEQDQVQEAQLQGVVDVLPPVAHDECLERLAAADVLLLVQTEAPLCVPGKVFEYIALGKTVFTLSGDGATADLVRCENLGPCVDPDNVEEIAAALLQLYGDFAAGRPLARPTAASRDRFDGRRLTETLNTLLQRSISQRSDRPEDTDSRCGEFEATASEMDRQ